MAYSRQHNNHWHYLGRHVQARIRFLTMKRQRTLAQVARSLGDDDDEGRP